MNAHAQPSTFKASITAPRRPVIPADLLPLVTARAERDGIPIDDAYAAILQASYEAQRKARERVEYEDPYGYDGRRY